MRNLLSFWQGKQPPDVDLSKKFVGAVIFVGDVRAADARSVRELHGAAFAKNVRVPSTRAVSEGNLSDRSVFTCGSNEILCDPRIGCDADPANSEPQSCAGGNRVGIRGSRGKDDAVDLGIRGNRDIGAKGRTSQYSLAHWEPPLASNWQPYSSRPRWDRDPIGH